MPSRMPDADLTDACLGLIREQHVMTLATFSSDGSWSTPVYYLYQDGRFFFFSSKTSRHIQDGLASPEKCSASVYEDQDCFDRIRGIQMSGDIRLAEKTIHTAKAAALYIKRFKIKTDASDALASIERLYHAKFFIFFPDTVLYMDNAYGFGSRQTIQL